MSSRVLLFEYVILHGFVCKFPLKLQMNKVNLMLAHNSSINRYIYDTIHTYRHILHIMYILSRYVTVTMSKYCLTLHEILNIVEM